MPLWEKWTDSDMDVSFLFNDLLSDLVTGGSNITDAFGDFLAAIYS